MSRRRQAERAPKEGVVSLERLRHGPVELVPMVIADAAGRPARQRAFSASIQAAMLEKL